MEEKLTNSVTPRPWRRKQVLAQHTDHAGVMWHAYVPGWRRHGWGLASAGLDYAVMSRMGLEMPVVSLRVDYLQALRHGDWVTVESLCLP